MNTKQKEVEYEENIREYMKTKQKEAECKKTKKSKKTKNIPLDRENL